AATADAHASDVGRAPDAGDELILGDEGRTLALAEAIDSVQLAPDAAPQGWNRAGAYVYPNDQVVLEANDPATTAARIEHVWGRLGGEGQYFTTRSDPRSVFNTVCEAFATPAGASAAMGPLSPVPASQQAVLAQDPPVQLGDETVAFKATLLWPGSERRD